MGDYMTTEAEQQATDEQESAAFNAGFDSIRNGSEGEQPPEHRYEEPEDQPQEQEPEQPEEDALAGLGLTASEIKSLLQRAAKVDSIEDALGKAHGKIGELNRTLQELKSSGQRPTQQQAPAGGYDDESLTEFESTFPEFAPAVEARARRIAQEVMQQSAQAGQQPDPEAVSKAVNLAVMDATHKGWRDTVASQDFDLWIATQPDSVRQTYATTWDHNELGEILGQFSVSRRAVADRTTKSKQRLEAAITPDSRALRVSRAATELDAMQAGFESVRNPRYYQ